MSNKFYIINYNTVMPNEFFITIMKPVVEIEVGHWFLPKWKRFLSWGKFENQQQCPTVLWTEFQKTIFWKIQQCDI